MTLTSLALANVRNHSATSFECDPGIVVFLGENGAGKTTVLEAISLLCTTRSFVTTQDRSLIRSGEERFHVDGRFRSDLGSMHTVTLDHPTGNGRRAVTLDNAAIPTPAELFGRFPVVSLSPLQREITAGGPAERRNFLDFVISQVHRPHLLDLLEYRRILSQRAAVLSDTDLSPARMRSLLEPWNQTCALHAVRIGRRRLDFIEAFAPYFDRTYPAIVERDERPLLRYTSSDGIDYRAAEAASELLAAIEGAFDADHRRRATTVGPHRDDMDILLNGLEARTRASQGQHKSILVSLKIAEYAYLNDALEETPMLLFDDVFSELDSGRLEGILRLMQTAGQAFVTTASEAVLGHLPASARRTVFRVRDGHVEREAA